MFIFTEGERTISVYIYFKREAIPCLYSLKERCYSMSISTEGERPFMFIFTEGERILTE